MYFLVQSLVYFVFGYWFVNMSTHSLSEYDMSSQPRDYFCKPIQNLIILIIMIII